MSVGQVQEQVSIIRSMIERSRRETAESGLCFVWMGVISLAAVLAIDRLEAYDHTRLVLPALLATLVGNGVVGYLVVSRAQQRAGARSYSSSICYGVWFACAVPAVIAVFVLPLLRVYPWSAVPVVAPLMLGIGVFASGMILEFPPLSWSSLAWWGGAVAMVFAHGTPRALIMAGVILLGWILPGLLLNREYQRAAGKQ